jgi:HlyD family secretion protein
LYATGTNMAAPASPLAEITTLGEGVRVEVFVSTQDVYSISIGDTVELTLRQRGQDIVYPGTVVGIGDTAEVRYSALGVEERKVKITIEPDLRGFNETVLGDGFALDVKFILYEAPNKLIIPKTALFKDGGEDKVWVVRGGATHTVAVQTGMELRTEVVVEGGLNEGDFVVSDANNKDLREGIKIAHP